MIIFRVSMIILITIQLASAQDDNNSKLDPTKSNFQPSLFVVIGVLSFMFSLTFLLLIYAKMCHREPTAAIHNHDVRGMFGTSTRFSGIDKQIIESLPYFRFSTLKGAKQGLQCSVCLAEFEDIEILRLLPKCKHGFHIECIDQWLENHSTCPLCRQVISAEDLAGLLNSSSMRLILEGGKNREDATQKSSNFELVLEREDGAERSSSRRFSSTIGDSFRRILHVNKKEEISIQEAHQPINLHRVNHQIVVSDVMFKNRWSNVSSSDLMFLNSEMLGVMTSDRFSKVQFGVAQSGPYCSTSDRFSSSNLLGITKCDDFYSMVNIKEEIERKRMFEHKVCELKSSSNTDSSLENFENSIQSSTSPARTSCSLIISGDQKRAMSEISAISRFKDLKSMKNKLRQCLRESDNYGYNDVIKEDIKRRRKWFPIAKRTVQWFANRENNRSHDHQLLQSQEIGHTVDV